MTQQSRLATAEAKAKERQPIIEKLTKELREAREK